MHVLVQINRRWPGYAERYRVEKGSSRFCVGPEGKAEHRQRKAAGAPRLCSVESKVGFRRITICSSSGDIRMAPDRPGPQRPFDPVRNCSIAGRAASKVPKGCKAVDILGANACAMSYAECAYELQDAADFLLAPEITMPFAGAPTTRS